MPGDYRLMSNQTIAVSNSTVENHGAHTFEKFMLQENMPLILSKKKYTFDPFLFHVPQ
jgi:hypothetical protein